MPYPQISRFYSPFIEHEGKYVLRLNDGEAKQVTVGGGGILVILEMVIVESSNPNEPVGEKRIHTLRLNDDGTPWRVCSAAFSVLNQLNVGDLVSLDTTAVKAPLRGRPLLRHDFSIHVARDIKSTYVTINYPTIEGATCTRCKRYNEYAAPSAAYVCFECR